MNAMQQLSKTLTETFSPEGKPTAAEKKAAREAERAKRFPTEAKKAAEAKPAAKKKSTRAATPAAPKEVKAKPIQVPFVVKRAVAGKPVFAINDVNNARPVAGTRLFAHTHAALTMMGLLDAKCPAIPTKIVLSVMGQRAVAYHTKERNFEAAPNHSLRLTREGYNKFTGRHADGGVDTALANEFMNLFLTGKAGKTGIAQGEVFQLA